MKRKNLILTVSLLAFVVGGLIYQSIGLRDNSVRDQQTPTNDKKNDSYENPESIKRDVLKANEMNDRSENEHLSFSRYKDLYNQMRPGTSPEYYNKSNDLNEEDCEETNEGALIEFIFMKRTDQGELTPYPVKRLLLKKRDPDACGDSIIHNTLDKYPRFVQMVTTDCVECGAGPGTLYEIRRLGDHYNLRYSVRIPKKSNLDFQDHFDQLTGTRDDKVYRIPLLVNEIIKTKVEEEEEGNEYTFSVSGIDKQVSRGMKIELEYRKNGRDIGFDYSVQDGRATFLAVAQNKEDVLNGNIFVYQRFDHEQVRKHDISEEEISPEKLLQYQRNVHSLTVNLSSNLEFDHRKKKWVQKTIMVEPLLEKVRKRKGWEKGHELMEQLRSAPVTLNDPHMGNVKIDESTPAIYRNKPPEISSSFSAMMNGALRSPLIAPPGKYNLYIGPYKVKDDYIWPPTD